MFLVLSLPRSRSAWLAHYLAYLSDRKIGHEVLSGCESVDEFLQNYKMGMWGTVETGGAGLWSIIRRELPECKIVLIRRPLMAVYQSLAKAGVVGDLSHLAEQEAMLDAAATDPNIVSIQFKQLSDPMICRWIFEHCLEVEFDFDWWAAMAKFNIQVDMPKWVEKIRELDPIYKKLYEDVKKRTERYNSRLQ